MAPFPRLSRTDGPGNWHLRDSEKVYVLGRHPHRCDIVIPEGSLSRQHAQFRCIDGEFWVEDMHSRGGTYLNGKALVGPAVLKDGDTLRFGDVVCFACSFVNLDDIRDPYSRDCALIDPEQRITRPTEAAWREVCVRLWHWLQVSHVHYPDCETVFAKRLLSPQSPPRQILGEGFRSVVVLDAAAGVGEDGEFALSRFLPVAVATIAAQFGLALPGDAYDPDEFVRVVKDQARSLFCLLNIQLITARDLNRLGRMIGDGHRVLYCGPGDFEAGTPKHLSGPIRGGLPENYPWSDGTPGWALSLDDLLPTILETLFRVFAQAEWGFVVMQQGADGPLVPMAVRYRREDDAPGRISRTAVRHVMSSKEAFLSADAAIDPQCSVSRSIADFRIRSYMLAPLVAGSESALGAIGIDTLDQRRRFQEGDLEVFAAVSAQAATAIERAQRHAETQ